jgi:hypothetical protein
MKSALYLDKKGPAGENLVSPATPRLAGSHHRIDQLAYLLIPHDINENFGNSQF